jgi:ATP-binding cassette subfamily C protein
MYRMLTLFRSFRSFLQVPFRAETLRTLSGDLAARPALALERSAGGTSSTGQSPVQVALNAWRAATRRLLVYAGMARARGDIWIADRGAAWKRWMEANDTPKAMASPLQAPLSAWQSVARRTIAIVVLFSIVVNLLMLTLPIYLFQISDRVLTSRSLDTLLMLTLLALCFLAVLSVIDILRRQILGRLAAKLEALLGGPVLASLLHNARGGEGGNVQALRSLQQVRNFISSSVMLLIIDVPFTPLYLGVIFFIHPHLGFLALGSGVLLFSIAVLNQKATVEPLTRANACASRADAAAESLGRNAQVINAMGMLDESILHWGRQQAQFLTLQNAAVDRNLWISGVSKFVRYVTQIILLGWGAYLALEGELTGGMMIAAAIIVGRALQPLEGLIEGWRSFVQARAAYKKARATIEAMQSDKPKLLLPKAQGRVAVERVLYLPPGSKEAVLNGVNFSLDAGESLAIVGPSGSGKSTLARVLVGCIVPTAGKVRLDGTELRNWDRRQFGEYTGYLPQEVELFPGTITQNICRMREGLSDAAIYEAAMLTDVHDMVCQLPNGYETILERGGSPLSGGQKQRIALARAFFGNPSLVVLDEPNSNLDAAGEQALAATLARAKERRVTVVVVTLRPALLHNVDKVLILRGGRAEAFGPPEDVLHRMFRSGGEERSIGTPPNRKVSAKPEERAIVAPPNRKKVTDKAATEGRSDAS